MRDLAGDDIAKESISTLNDNTDRSISALATQNPKRKVKRAQDAEEDADELEARSSWEISKISARPQKTISFTGIHPSEFIFPKSQYEGWTPPLPKSREIDALNDLRVSLDYSD